MNGTVLPISLLAGLLVVYRKTSHSCVLLVHLASLLEAFVRLKGFLRKS